MEFTRQANIKEEIFSLFLLGVFQQIDSPRFASNAQR
jgi:hypothetical protein